MSSLVFYLSLILALRITRQIESKTVIYMYDKASKHPILHCRDSW